MTDGENPQSFAEFEAAIQEGKVAEPEAKPDKAAAEGILDASLGAETDEPLELTEDDEAVEVAQDEEGGEPDPKDGEHKRRSKPAAQRIAELTAKLREAERERDALKTPPPANDTAKAPEKPDPADFEFGEADPAYIDKLTDWKLDSREAEKAKATEAARSQQEMVDKINEGVAGAEKAALEKYEDFEDKIAAAVEARGGEPLPPMLHVAIGLSPVGGDLLYRLATDEAASERLEKLAKGGAATTNAMALAFGELEGEYLDDDDDLDITDQLDMARMLGRMKSRLKGVKAPEKKSAAEIADTQAPEPPSQRARGGSGRFEVGADTTDFAAFERKVNGKR